MRKMHRFTLILTLVLLAFLLFIPSASARPQARTYTVISNVYEADANPGDDICATAGGQCTLYAAIQEANADGESTTIKFAQQFMSPNSISSCSLPTLTEAGTTIDASDRWHTTYDRPGVELIGGVGCAPLTIQANNTTVLGIGFYGYGGGLELSGGSNNYIGGSGTGERNVFVGNVDGVYISGGSWHYIRYNYFGTIDGATASGIEEGVFVYGASNNTISHNVVGGASGNGIYVMTSDNTVSENDIGISWNHSTAIPNKIGIYVYGDSNTIQDNFIAGNSSHGVYLHHADDNDVTHNTIGYSYGSTGNGGNGIHLLDADNNRITGNNIYNNTGNGIYAIASSDNTIQDNNIDSNDQVGIYFSGCHSSRIGSPGPGQLNTITLNGSHGIRLETSDTITVTSNRIGLSSGAYDGGNLIHGILIDNGSTYNVIGGANPGEANWIGWNHGSGVLLDGSTTRNNLVIGNVIGAPTNWAFEAPNWNHGVGIYNGAYDNRIGQLGDGGGNIILANGWTGVAIVGSNNNWVLGNSIGTNGIGINWGNAYYGITVGGSGTIIMLNEIAFNGTNGGLDNAQAGVLVDGVASIDNLISRNSIHENDGPGIKLANSGNHNLAAPVITSANCNQVQGTTCANCLVEIYSSFDDEGRLYEGVITASASGTFSWNDDFDGPNITALAIGAGSSSDTSPFSSPFFVGMCHPPLATATSSATVTPTRTSTGTLPTSTPTPTPSAKATSTPTRTATLPNTTQTPTPTAVSVVRIVYLPFVMR